MYITYATCWENPYLAAVVKIQTDRGQQVVSTGPYSVVRHPLYAGMLLMFPSTGLMLGSWYGVAASIPLAVTLMVRAVLEERELQTRLPGYSDYMKQSAIPAGAIRVVKRHKKVTNLQPRCDSS